MSLGYTKEEIIRMTKQLPALFGYSIDNIKRKINFLINAKNVANKKEKLILTFAIFVEKNLIPSEKIQNAAQINVWENGGA